MYGDFEAIVADDATVAIDANSWDRRYRPAGFAIGVDGCSIAKPSAVAAQPVADDEMN